MQTTLGFLADILVLGIFIFLILQLHGKVKMRPEKREKLDDMLKRRGNLYKTFVYVGAAGFAINLMIKLFRL